MASVSKEILKAVIAAHGWKLVRSRASGSHERLICVTKQVEYDLSRTKAQQKAIVNSIAKAVGAEHNGVSSIEWTNEDGGDFNTVEVYMYVGI